MTLHFPDPVFANDSDYAAMRDLFRAAYFTRKDIPTALGIPSVESFRQFQVNERSCAGHVAVHLLFGRFRLLRVVGSARGGRG